MELIRDYRDYPWQRIVLVICLALPLVPTLLGLPHWTGPRANESIAIWLDSTLKFAALSLCCYASFDASRRHRHVESSVVTFVLLAAMYFGSSSSLRFGPDDGTSVVDVLFTDRGLAWTAVMAAVAVGVLVAVRWRRTSPG